MHHFIVRTLNVCVYTAINMYIESSEHNHCWLQPAWFNLPKLMTFLLCPVCLFSISSLSTTPFSLLHACSIFDHFSINCHQLSSSASLHTFSFPSRMCVFSLTLFPPRNYPKKLTSRPSSPPILVRLARRWPWLNPAPAILLEAWSRDISLPEMGNKASRSWVTIK